MTKPSDLTEIPLEQLTNLQVTSASKYLQKILESPHDITVITHEDIEKSGALNLPEVLKFAMGVFVFEHGNKPEVVLRGNPQEFQPGELVLMDGVPIYNPSHSTTLWAMLPIFLSSIDRVEIIHGAASTLYGANAYSGVINIISKKIEDRHAFHGFASGGNLGTTVEDAFWSGPVSKKVRLRIAGTLQHDNGYGSDNGDGQFDGTFFGQGKAELEVNFSERTKLNFYSYGRGGDLKWAHPLLGNVDSDFRFLINGIHVQHDFSSRQNLSFQTTYLNNVFDSKPSSPGVVHQSLHHFDSDLNYVFRIIPRDTLTAGGNFRIELNKAAILPPGFQTTSLASFFVNNNFKILDNLILTTGGRYEWDNFTHSQLTGRANLSYLPTENHALRISIARAVRTPAVVETRLQVLNQPAPSPPLPPGSVLDVVGNPNLKPESEVTTEFGYLGSFFKNHVKLDTQFYFNFVNDTITAGGFSFNPTSTPPRATVTVINNDSGKVFGVESEVTWQIFDWWKTSLNYTRTQQSGFETSKFPANLLSFKNRIALRNGFSNEILFNWASPYSVFNRTNGQKTDIGNIFRLDVRLAQKFYKKRFEVAVVGENLVDVPRNESSLEFGVPLRVDRRIFGTLSFTY